LLIYFLTFRLLGRELAAMWRRQNVAAIPGKPSTWAN
jgi:hypothetical protein